MNSTGSDDVLSAGAVVGVSMGAVVVLFICLYVIIYAVIKCVNPYDAPLEQVRVNTDPTPIVERRRAPTQQYVRTYMDYALSTPNHYANTTMNSVRREPAYRRAEYGAGYAAASLATPDPPPYTP